MAATEPATRVARTWLGFLIPESPLVPIICFLSPILQPSQRFQRLPYYLANQFLFA